jgi:formate hydrogenlyase subunit 3/multisubunit Na+/H+ antiporter MnhD subunit
MTVLFWITIACFILGALCSVRPRPAYLLGFAGSLAALALAIWGLNQAGVIWTYPLTAGISLSVGIDHLSALFLLMLAICGIMLALYSIDYASLYPQRTLSIGFNIAFAGMLVVLLARDGFTLLIGWETMTIFAFLMMLPSGKHFEQSYKFMAFGEVSTVFLLLGFAVLYENSGTVAFSELSKGSSLFLVLISLGFIVKMDIVPFHGWMRGIYGEIPDNTAAILSAPVTLMGVYGLERVMPAVPKNEAWNLIIIILGAFSAFWGGLQAVAANKVKLLPAYSTVENNGMILTAVGLYALAVGLQNEQMQYLSIFAQTASIMLALSHSFAKTLMFMSVGHAKEAYQVQTIDQARGVWSGVGKIPAMGIVIAALSFSAFPPLIGYSGEWMLLETLFQSYRFPQGITQFLAAIAGVLTALAIGLIGFAMIKLIGYTALGFDHGRKSVAIPNRLMNATQLILQVLLVAGGLGLPAVIMLIGYPQLLIGLLGIPAPLVLASGQPVFGVISPTFIGIVMFFLLAIPFFLFRSRRRKVRKVNSWNGGIPLREEEYFSAQAYSQILEHILRRVYRTREISSETHRRLEVEDVLTGPMQFLTRLVQKIGEGEALVIMNGKISAYVTYILVLFVLTFLIGVGFS